MNSFNHFIYSALITSIATFALGLFVLLKSKWRNNLYLIFALYSFSVSLWSFCAYKFTPDFKDPHIFWGKLLHVGAILIPVLFVDFIFRFISKKKRKLLIIIYSIGGYFLFLDLFTNYLINGIVNKADYSFPAPGIAYPFFFIFFIFCVSYSFLELYSAYRTSTSIKHNQLKYLLVGSFFGYLGGLKNFLIIVNFKPFPIYPFGTYLIPLYVAMVTYAIIRFRLLDINIVLTRAGIFTVVYAFILGIPLLLGQKYGLWKYSTWAMLILATSGPFLYNYLRHRAEDVIFKDQRRYQRALIELSKITSRIRDLNKLLKTIVSTIVDTVKVNSCAIYLKDEEYKCFQLKEFYPAGEKGKLEDSIRLDSVLIDVLIKLKRPVIGEELRSENIPSLDAGLVVPLIMEDDLQGFLVIGSKPNNLIYTLEDILVFETLSYSTGLAIENCIFWKEIEDRQRKARLQEMDTYSYSLAHEIDNPMQVILGHANLVKKLVGDLDIPEDKHKGIIESLDFIYECQQRVSGMVKAIRDFGQKTTGQLKPLNIEDVVDSFARLYYPEFKAKSVYFEKQSTLSSPVFVRGEKPELMQVLVIVANNSVHAMTGLEQKRAQVKIETANHDKVRITFADNGYGIKKEMLEIIFTPFTTTKASTEGTGMGLYNAKNIINKHKGKIWAESAGPNKGAAFVIELPIALDVKPEDLQGTGRGKSMF